MFYLDIFKRLAIAALFSGLLWGAAYWAMQPASFPGNVAEAK